MKGLFAERKGYKPTIEGIQVESIDSALKNRLWSVLYTIYFEPIAQVGYAFSIDRDPIVFPLWDEFFKRPVDTLPRGGHEFVNFVRDYFYSGKWFDVFDLIEAVLRCSNHSGKDKGFTVFCNRVFEDEVAGYRLISGQITPITHKEGIRSVEDALGNSPNLVSQHLERALELLSDRKEPDFRNSIKESICAIEALCRQITDEPKLTLGKALSKIEQSEKVDFHPAFREACNKLYGWTNDEDGVRHSLMDKSNLSQEDARFMLVACSTFTNYLIVKADKAGIQLPQ